MKKIEVGHWKIERVSGGNIRYFNETSRNGVFTGDGKYFIVIKENEIVVFDYSRGSRVNCVSINDSEIQDCIVEGEEIYFFCLKGSIKKMRSLGGNIDEIRDAKQRGNWDVCSVLGKQGDNFFFLERCGGQRRIMKFFLGSNEDYSIFSVDEVSRHCISIDGNWVGFLCLNNEIKIINMRRIYSGEDSILGEKDINTVSSIMKQNIVSVAITEGLVGLGTSYGTIELIETNAKSDVGHRFLKWHIGRVCALRFTEDDKYLLSGGEERVLVSWQLDTGNMHFLPRLNGTVEKIDIDLNKSECYVLTMSITAYKKKHGKLENKNLEVLVLSAIDFTSRLSISTIKPIFGNCLERTLKRISKKDRGIDLENIGQLNVKHDYSCNFEIHPKTNNLYFPNFSSIQAYDMIGNKQVFVQNFSSFMSAGKVKSESKIQDPFISIIAFNYNGDWMCTYETITTSKNDNILHENGIQYVLKFWKYNSRNNQIDSRDSLNNIFAQWELTTKIINPHNKTNPISCIVSFPGSISGVNLFLTVDDKGGLRIWKPKILKNIEEGKKTKSTQTTWYLENSRLPLNSESDFVSVCWSDDGSVLFLSHKSSIHIIDPITLNEITPKLTNFSNISGSKILSLFILNNDLIVLSQTKISSINLVTGNLNPFNAQIKSTPGQKNLFSVNKKTNTVCLCSNFYVFNDSLINVNSKIMIFNLQSLSPIFCHISKTPISSIRLFNSSYILIDSSFRIWSINLSDLNFLDEKLKELNLSLQFDKIIQNAESTSSLINFNTMLKTNPLDPNNSYDPYYKPKKIVDVHTFQRLLENSESAQPDVLFDRIINLIK